MALGNYTTFTLDMVPGGRPPIIHVSAGDVGRKYTANLTYNGVPYDIQGNRLTIVGTKPDNTVFEYPVDDFEQNESCVDFLIEEQMAIVPGTVRCKLREYLNDDQIGSATFILDVDEYVYDPEAASESYIPSFETAIQEALENVADDIADLATAAAINDVKQYSDAASASATAAAGSATSAQTSAGSATSAAEDAEDAADRAEAAAESMAAYNTDRTPYLLRQSGGGVETGDREYDTIVGGTVAFNQLCNGSSVTVQNGHKYLSKTGSTWTVGASTGTAISNLTSGSDMVIDLTQMFGSTIADYIYNLEQATAGAGVAYFRKLFPEDYYPYDAGSLKSVEGVSAHETVGKNLLNMVDVLPNGSYSDNTFNCSNLKSRPKVELFPTPTNIVFSYKSGTFTGTGGRIIFYNGDTSITNKGLAYTSPQSVSVNNVTSIRFDYSTTGTLSIVEPMIRFAGADATYEPYKKYSYPLDSSLTLRGILKKDSNNSLYFDGDTYESDGTVTRKYGVRAYQSGDESLANAITDGTNTVYKLTTPTTETADPFTNPQVVDQNGTEQYVTDSIVPVGHDTRYRVNLRDKLEPIFEVPTADGTYTLKVTVSNGVATYSWESQ